MWEILHPFFIRDDCFLGLGHLEVFLISYPTPSLSGGVEGINSGQVTSWDRLLFVNVSRLQGNLPRKQIQTPHREEHINTNYPQTLQDTDGPSGWISSIMVPSLPCPPTQNISHSSTLLFKPQKAQLTVDCSGNWRLSDQSPWSLWRTRHCHTETALLTQAGACPSASSSSCSHNR